MDNLSGLRIKRSRFNLSHRKIFDAGYYSLIPILYYFALPGDVVTLGANIFVRSMPMLAPLMNKNEIDVRYFEVPIRLVEPTFERVVTGSADGKLLTHVPSLPKFNFRNIKEIKKYSFFDYLGCPVGNVGNDFPVSNYVPKSYYRVYWDYYRDENFSQKGDFEEAYNQLINSSFFQQFIQSSNIQKNYFSSALPWQLKGEIPTFTFNVSAYADFSNAMLKNTEYSPTYADINLYNSPTQNFAIGAGGNPSEAYNNAQHLKDALNQNQVNFQGLSMNASELRSMFAQTRIMERLARCGSRYVEYLTSNFGIAPRDDTLQRAQYLGGFRQPLVFTEIPQTAQDESTPVGTLRGKGISSGGDTPVKKTPCKRVFCYFRSS